MAQSLLRPGRASHWLVIGLVFYFLFAFFLFSRPIEIKQIASMESLINNGQLLGLQGSALLEWCEKQQRQADEREQRVQQREQRAAQEAAAVRAAEAEERALERERLQLHAAQQEREHALALRQLELGAAAPAPLPADFPERPKLPVYRDGDDIASFFVRFERVAELLNVDRNSYAVRLGSLFTGRAVDHYAALSPEITSNYDRLKLAFLSAFKKNADWFRQEFRSVRLGSEESWESFSIRLGRLLDFWVESSGVESSAAGLRAFILQDQFLASLPNELRVHVKQCNPQSLPEMVSLAHHWSMARKNYGRVIASKPGPVRNEKPKDTSGKGQLYVKLKPEPGVKHDNRPLKCFACGMPGHVRARCPQNPASFATRAGPSPDTTVRFCKCMMVSGSESAHPLHPSEPQIQFYPEDHNRNVKTPCELAAIDKTPGHLMSNGTINGTPVTKIYRDTGCDGVVISSKLFPDLASQAKRSGRAYDFLDRMDIFPIARCYIDCDFYTGFVDALLAPLGRVTCLIGNIAGVRDGSVSPDARAAMPSDCPPLHSPESSTVDVVDVEPGAPTDETGSAATNEPPISRCQSWDTVGNSSSIPSTPAVATVATASIFPIGGLVSTIQDDEIECDTANILPACISNSNSAVQDPVSDSVAATDSGLGPDINFVSAEQDPVTGGVSESVSCCAVTRSQAGRRDAIHPLIIPNFEPLDIDRDEFIRLQKTCQSLDPIRLHLKEGLITKARDGSSYKVVENNGLLYRKCLVSPRSERTGQECLIVPAGCRRAVLSLAHQSPFSGHFFHRKTEWRVMEQFSWPGLIGDVRRFVQSCDVCQRLGSAGKVRPAPLCEIPIITQPFSRVSMDIVGPLEPRSRSGYRYILTLIDSATGFPEAVPLKNIDTISVSEALLSIFSRVGIPREILSDRGTQFTSALMGELHRLLGVKPLFTTAYHPMCNGRIERCHATLKSALKKLCSEKPTDWDRFLNCVMFALREMPSDRTGFSAFELLYGRRVRGPLAVLRDLWEDCTVTSEQRSEYQYVLDLQKRLEDCARLAAAQSQISSSKYKRYFDLKSQNRSFEVGDEVLLLLPDSRKKLLISWRGPYKVIEKRGKVNYLIDTPGRPSLYHINLLKRYYRREASVFGQMTETQGVVSEEDTVSVKSAVISEVVDLPDGMAFEEVDLPLPGVQTQSVADVQINLSADESTVKDLQLVCLEFADVLTDVPGLTSTVVHEIKLTVDRPIKPKIYPVPVHLQRHFRTEVELLLKLKIIRPSKSHFCSPVVLVKKADSSYRLAVDFRYLNSITVFWAEPTGSMEEDLHLFYDCKIFSEIDISKAYYQIPLSPEACALTAFQTHLGLMEFTRLPFGALCACASFIALMRIVLSGLKNVAFYFDNIFVYSKNWSDHLTALRAVFSRLREHGLTAKPSKCRLGYPDLNYLGFIVGDNKITPGNPKVDALLTVVPPSSKKILRSFLGLASFYRKFIENFGTLAAPLSDMLKKGVPEPLIWTEKVTQSFQTLKAKLAERPILALPNVEETFVLRSDASKLAVGAILLQYKDGIPFPVAYASRKLLPREQRYAVIEQELLAVVFGVDKFRFYMLGKPFVLELDHRPLVYLNTFKGNNSRLMRWALALQSYRFQVVYIPGKDNLGADLLSRANCG